MCEHHNFINVQIQNKLECTHQSAYPTKATDVAQPLLLNTR